MITPARTIEVEEVPALWRAGLACGGWRPAGLGRFVRADGGCLLELPPLLVGAGGEVRLEPGRALFVLGRAGRFAAGLFAGGGFVRHKVWTGYVVRGRGRAQARQLARKGKSRGGARIRLREHRRLLETVAAALAAWRADPGYAQVFHQIPVRLLADLRAYGDPFPLEDPWTRKIPWHVPRPGFRALVDCARRCARGRCGPLPPTAGAPQA